MHLATAAPQRPPFLAAVLVVFLLPNPRPLVQANSATANPDPITIQPLYLSPSPPATIPTFPEQSAASAGCPLELPDELFRDVHMACGGELRRARCCPVLAAWLYSAYSSTALGLQTTATAVHGLGSPPYDMPLLPDDSETCVNGLGKALTERGVELSQPNETCDVVYCYCGIRLHSLSCPEAFNISSDGKLRGNDRVKRLETDCFNGGSNRGLNGCSKCLNSLQMLTSTTWDPSKPEDRTTKIHNKDCHLMGLTWLLYKNRTAFIHPVSNVLRAIMMSPNESNPESCTLSSDGLPLAVDSAEISGGSPSSQFSLWSSPIGLVMLPLAAMCYRRMIVS